jgi:hypothetical protein
MVLVISFYPNVATFMDFSKTIRLVCGAIAFGIYLCLPIFHMPYYGLDGNAEKDTR